MNTVDRTFRICCKNGNPNGIRVISDAHVPFTTYIIPRKCMSETKNVIPADRCTGIYFLFDDARSKVYVGQTRKGIERIETHHHQKDFWSTAIMFLADNGTWKPLIDELELYATIKATEGYRFEVENKTKSKVDFKEEELNDIMDAVEFYLSVFDYSLKKKESALEPVKNNCVEVFATRCGIKAFGMYNLDDKTIVVLKGSEVRVNFPAQTKDVENLRQDCLKKGLIVTKNSKYILKQDVSFATLSPAAEFVIGGSCNGKTEWKTVDGKTLKVELGL